MSIASTAGMLFANFARRQLAWSTAVTTQARSIANVQTSVQLCARQSHNEASDADASERSAAAPAGSPPSPIEIKLLKNQKRLVVSYPDGANFRLSAELLRVCSPSADTKRQEPVRGRPRVVSGRRHVGILSVEAVGNYAIRIHFDDLHSAGIYTWDYLYDMGSRKWAHMRSYIRQLREAGASRDPRAAGPRGHMPTNPRGGGGSSSSSTGSGGGLPGSQRTQQQSGGDSSG